MKNIDNKIKEKIEKLLNLSMSDNKHEASIALEKALKLMSENNLTKEDIYKQNFIQKKYEANYYRMPDWLVRLYSYMASCSGCLFTWQNGDSTIMLKAHISFTGRERDVENAVYLSEFLKREIEKRAKIYKNEIIEINQAVARQDTIEQLGL